MKKYYYIDKDGNKKNYIGKIIKDYITGETYGLLTQQDISTKEVELIKHEEIKQRDGWSSYFTYINSDGDTVKYNGLSHNIKKNPIDNSYYITKVNNVKIDLIKHNKIDYKPGYFTYTSKYGKEIIYDGEKYYDKFTNSYYFYK